MGEGQNITVGGKYEIVRPLNSYGETVLYLGRDIQSGKNICLREFFSEAIMLRSDGGAAEIRPGCEVKFKSLSMDYEELCSYQMALPEDSPVIRPVEVIRDNNTIYSVEEYIDTETLDDYLARRDGRLEWSRLKRMIAPVIKLLGKMHADGVYHRGISPETILVTKDMTLLLSGFCIPAARTAQSELDATLYFGYSAPEQYASNSWQGSWSDVYSLAAVCYRALTGVTPVEWRQRGEGRSLVPPGQLNKALPDNVSNALQKALSVELSARYRTVEEFWCDLLLSSDGGTVTYKVPVVMRADSQPQPAQRGLRDLLRMPVVTVLIALSFVSVFSIAFAYRIADAYILPTAQQSQPPPPASLPPASLPPPVEEEPDPIVMPDLIGMDIEKILLDPLYQNLFTFQIERVFSETQKAGTVVEQSPVSGSEFETGARQQAFLQVSKGSEITAMPNLMGMTLEQAIQQMEMSDIGYSVSFVPAESDDGGLETGTVLETSISAGGVVRRGSDTVEIMVAEVIESPDKPKSRNDEYAYVPAPRTVTYWPPEDNDGEQPGEEPPEGE